MKKLLIPIVALLAFSILTSSVSANNGGYYAVRFLGSANGCCWVFEEELGSEPEPTTSGEGRFRIRGSAIALGVTDVYWAAPEHDPSTLVQTRTTYLRVRWDSETVMVHLWPSNHVYGMFADTLDSFYLLNMSFAGYYMGEAGLQYISGDNATIMHGLMGSPGEENLVSLVMLYIDTEHFCTFGWVGEEIPELPPGCVARSITHIVTVWPIEWHPTAIL